MRLEPAIDALGPDAAEITRAAFRERVSRSRMPVKARIMDQKVLAGVGNLLADEALWQARIDPRRPANGLEEADSTACATRSARPTARRSRAAASTPGKSSPAASRRRLPALRHPHGAGDRRRPHDVLVPRRAALIERRSGACSGDLAMVAMRMHRPTQRAVA